MSLLNEMLKNLDKRQVSSETPVGSGTPEVRMQPAVKTERKLLAKVAVFLLVILLVYVVGYFAVSAVKGHWFAAKVAKPVQPPIAELQKVYITQNQSEIVMQFTFNSTAQYKIDQNDTHSMLTINFSNVRYGNNVPLAPVGFIKALSTKSVGNDLQVIAETSPGTEVKVMQYQSQVPFQLIFVLSNDQEAQLAKAAMQKVAVPPSREEQANIDYQSALSLIAEDKFDEAIISLKKIVNDVSELLPARRALVVLLMKRNRLDEAMSYVTVGLKSMPESVDLIELDARLLLLQDKPVEALSVLQRISPAIDQETDYYALVASVQQRLGRYDVAVQIYQQLLAIDRSNSNWWIGLGLALESENKNNTALQAYQQALNIGDLSPGLQMNVQGKIAKLGK